MKVRTTKTRPPRPRGKRPAANARRANPLRRDPTRTAGIRRRWEAEVRRRFARLKAALYRLVVDEDAFGLAPPPTHPFAAFVGNAWSEAAREAALEARRSASKGKVHERQQALADHLDGASRAILGGLQSGKADHQEAWRQSEALAARAEKNTAANFARRYAALKESVARQYGEAALASPEWAAVKDAFRAGRDGALSAVRAHKEALDSVITDHAHSGRLPPDAGTALSQSWQDHATQIDRWLSGSQKALAAFAAKHGSRLTGNARFAFQTSPQQLQAFKAWLAGQVDSDVMGRNDDTLWRKYVEEGFRQGAARAFTDVRKPAAQAAKEEGAAFYEGGKEEFLRSAFAQPVAVEKVQLLASRTLNELGGVTDQMATAMVRTLADGLVRGSSPREIAADLSDDVGIAKDRSLTIVRTELIRAHSDGQLVAMEALGVETLGVQVEVLVTDDDRLCPICADLAGRTFTLEEAQGLIPVHPNCRCTFTPSGVGEFEKEPGAAVTNARRVCAPPSAAPPCDCTPALLDFSRFLHGGKDG